MDSGSVVIELPPDLSEGAVVLAAALTVLPADLRLGLVLTGIEEPTVDDARRVTTTCLELGDARKRSVELLGESEARESEQLAWVKASDDPRATALAVANLAAVTFVLQDKPAESSRTDDPTELLRRRDALAAQRESLRKADRPMLVVIAQVQSTWGAVDDIVRALHQRTDLKVEIVAVESEHELRSTSTSDFLRAAGFTPRDLGWLQDQLRNPSLGLAGALFYDPWDGLRPEVARSQTLAALGVRIAYVPYGTNVGGGKDTESYAYNLPVHQLASRIYARSHKQKDMFRDFCASGDSHVQVLGVPKFDRMRDLPPKPTTGPVVILWNPHFSIEDGGWSTYMSYVDNFLAYAGEHPDVTLIVRPHFRLLRDAPLVGGALSEKVEHLMAAPARLANIEIDTKPDHLESFRRADVMVSDLSSLFPEFLVTGKPILYLHRPDSPGVNLDAQYFFEGPVALDWHGIETFLEDARARRDGGARHRQLTIARHFERLDGRSSERIAADIASMITDCAS